MPCPRLPLFVQSQPSDPLSSGYHRLHHAPPTNPTAEDTQIHHHPTTQPRHHYRCGHRDHDRQNQHHHHPINKKKKEKTQPYRRSPPDHSSALCLADLTAYVELGRIRRRVPEPRAGPFVRWKPPPPPQVAAPGRLPPPVGRPHRLCDCCAFDRELPPLSSQPYARSRSASPMAHLQHLHAVVGVYRRATPFALRVSVQI
ncbi:extensin [Iris pallida]|uniref:Extensin n=1 Tax=Iris pallida TaxID=29817 RepID=A0AAX6IH64_IRIPA|nr:extensin [Iris pallida]